MRNKDEEQLEKWSSPSKVDLAVAKLSRQTVLPTEEICSLQDPLDRWTKTTLKWGYVSATTQCAVGTALCEVTKSLRDWIHQIHQDGDSGVPQDDILGSSTPSCPGAKMYGLAVRSLA